jgi:hypothetical protein
VSELAHLKAPSGLFSEPLATGNEPLSLYATALYHEDGYDPHGGFSIAASLLEGSQESSIDTSMLFTWAYVELSGATVSTPTSLPRVTDLTTSLPAASSDPGQEIGMLWAWADKVTRVSPRPPSIEPAVAKQRLSALNVQTIKSPYLLWRLGQTYSLLKMPKTVALSRAQSRAQAPSSLTSVTSVLDTQGYLALVKMGTLGLSAPAGIQKRVRQALQQSSSDDDLTRASLLNSVLSIRW